MAEGMPWCRVNGSSARQGMASLGNREVVGKEAGLATVCVTGIGVALPTRNPRSKTKMVSGVMRRSWAERHWVWSRNFFGDIFATPKETPPQWMLLGIFLLLAGVYWGVHYQPYILPNSDFFRIQEMAAQLMSGKMPDDLRQMPLVPILMVPFALFLPVEENIYLHAISVLNIVLSLGSLALLYFLARVFLGSALAFIPVLLLLAAPQFTVSAHQPMLEPAIGFFSLATFLALARRSGWAYVFAGLCALARYEMAALLAVVFVVECFRAPRQWFAIGLKCTLAGLPFLIWFALSMLLPAGGNQYIDEVVRAPLGDVVSNMQSPVPMPSAMHVLFIALAWSLGVYAAFRRDPSLALGVVCFFLLYTAAHFVYGRPLPRYSYPMLWILPLFATIALHVLLRLARPLAERMNGWVLGAAGMTLTAAAVFLSLRSLELFSQGFPSGAIASQAWYLGWSFILLGAIFAVVLYAAQSRPHQRLLAAIAAVVFVCAPVILGAGSLARTAAAVHYDK
ncbi:hypothetical protein, partial [Aquisalimonas sp.]|uniref:hypothetical protein n=1 Tax=Aquisalimonas sp. TaxID=1872621 RepID=UPI0025BB2C3C